MPKIFRVIYNFFQLILQYLRAFKQRELIEYFTLRNQIWKKKKPSSEQFPFFIHDPIELFGEYTGGFEKLYLIGENWSKYQNKPVAIVIGCNDWKYGFIADYLPEFRTAFGSRKLTGINMVKVIWKLAIKPEVALIWGYTENFWLRSYLKFRKIPIWRMEDAFIRSASLGATHSTPYSLVFDKTGLYYNSKEPSDIENLLNTYDFNQNQNLKEDAGKLLEYLCESKISKYNPPTMFHNTDLKMKKKILVIGQVDQDASLKYGNPDGWTMEEMVRLAKFENFDADVFYRPHPEVYEGYQKSRFKKKNIESFAKVISPDEHIIDLIERVDHVYTLTSLTGLEALLRNKKVTVLGVPFYAGWGLTDDRAKRIKRRNRKLTLQELFIGAYLLYPKYLANQNSPNGIISTVYRIKADRYELLSNTNVVEQTGKVDGMLFISKMLKSKALTGLSENYIRDVCDSSLNYYNEVIPLLIISLASNEREIISVLRQFKNVIDLSIFNRIVLLVDKYFYSENTLSIWNEMFLDEKQFQSALEEIDNRYDFFLKKTYSSSDGLIDFEEIRKKYSDIFFEEKFRVLFESKDFIKSKVVLNDMALLSSKEKKSIIKNAIDLSEIVFDFKTVEVLSKLLGLIDVRFSNGYAISKQQRIFTFMDKPKHEFMASVLNVAKFKPDMLVSTYFLMEKLYDKNECEQIKSALEDTLKLDNKVSVGKINAYISIGQYEKAVSLATVLCGDENISEGNLVILSQALSYDEKISDAIAIVEEFQRRNGFSKRIVTELMRLYVLNSEYEKSYKLLEKALLKGLKIGAMHKRKCYFGNKMISEALFAFKEIDLAERLEVYFPEKYVNTKEELMGADTVTLLSVYGPGDEIRFASIYKKVDTFLKEQQIHLNICCSPKLHSLMKNSFTNINFVGVMRPRGLDVIDVNDYSIVPGSDLCSIVDNNAMPVIESADRISLVSDLLYDFLPTKDHFSGTSYLKPDPVLKAKMQHRLEKFSSKILIGLSWRSSLNTVSRNEHYLSVEELLPIFEIEEVQFVNLQYDECSEEIEYVNSRFPGKLINFEDIDQYDDLDSVAALISCMDLVISPATTVVELAGALGAKTWMFSNSSEIDWRKIDDAGTDIWHNSITILDVKRKGDKGLLVEEIQNRLTAFVHENLAQRV